VTAVDAFTAVDESDSVSRRPVALLKALLRLWAKREGVQLMVIKDHDCSNKCETCFEDILPERGRVIL
jgi:hypothetical protein